MGLHLFFFSFLRGLFYKKVPVSWGPSGTYYGSLVVINHGRVSISTQCLPRVSNSHSLTVSSTVAFLSICPLFSVAPTWTLRNWSFSCWHVCFLFLFFFPALHRKKPVLAVQGWDKAWERSEANLCRSSQSPYFSLCSYSGCCLLEKPITVSMQCEQCFLPDNIWALIAFICLGF